MLTVTIQIRAENWKAARVALRQAYQRDLAHTLRPGPNGEHRYELRVTDEQKDSAPFSFSPDI